MTLKNKIIKYTASFILGGTLLYFGADFLKKGYNAISAIPDKQEENPFFVKNDTIKYASLEGDTTNCGIIFKFKDSDGIDKMFVEPLVAQDSLFDANLKLILEAVKNGK